MGHVQQQDDVLDGLCYTKMQRERSAHEILMGPNDEPPVLQHTMRGELVALHDELLEQHTTHETLTVRGVHSRMR